MADNNNAEIVVDGQLAVATVEQSGTIVASGGKIDATCVVQTDNGPQLAIKTVSVGGGGGGGEITVDQHYSATSENAQSGTAVAEGLATITAMTGASSGHAGAAGLVPAPAAGDQAKYLTGAGTWATPASGGLENTATGTNSLTINGTAATAQECINIGSGSKATYTQSTALGRNANATGNYGATAIGYASYAEQSLCSALGNSSTAAGSSAVAIGASSLAEKAFTTALGGNSQATAASATAIGYNAKATAQNAIQIGNGTNSTANTLYVAVNAQNYQLLNSSGKIPDARLDLTTITGYDATKTQTLKHVQGTLTWVDD